MANNENRENVSIKRQISDALGIDKNESWELIKAYKKSHGQEVDAEQIISDLQSIGKEMAHQVGNLYSEYNVKREIFSNNKARIYEGILNLLHGENTDIMDLAESYLNKGKDNSLYYNSTKHWANTLIKVTQKELRTVLEGDIHSYRAFVDELPFQNVQRVAQTFNMESQFVDFIAKNGNWRDFKTYCSYEAFSRNKPEVNYYRGVNANVRDKLFSNLKEHIKENDVTNFDLNKIRKDLATVFKSQDLTDEQKGKVQDLYIEDVVKNGRNGELSNYFMDIVKKNTYLETSETIDLFLNHDLETAKMMYSFAVQEDLERVYEYVVEDLNEKDNLSVDDIFTAMLDNGLTFSQDDDKMHFDYKKYEITEDSIRQRRTAGKCIPAIEFTPAGNEIVGFMEYCSNKKFPRDELSVNPNLEGFHVVEYSEEDNIVILENKDEFPDLSISFVMENDKISSIGMDRRTISIYGYGLEGTALDEDDVKAISETRACNYYPDLSTIVLEKVDDFNNHEAEIEYAGRDNDELLM